MNETRLPGFLYRKGVPVWRDVVVLQWTAQIISAILVIGFIYFLISNLVRVLDGTLVRVSDLIRILTCVLI